MSSPEFRSSVWAEDLRKVVVDALLEKYEETKDDTISGSYLGDKVRMQNSIYEWREGHVGDIFEPSLVFIDPNDESESKVVASVFLMHGGNYAVMTQNLVLESLSPLDMPGDEPSAFLALRKYMREKEKEYAESQEKRRVADEEHAKRMRDIRANLEKGKRYWTAEYHRSDGKAYQVEIPFEMENSED